MVAALMTTLGVTVGEVHEAQQATAVFIIPFMLPVWFMQLIIENANGPLALGFSFFPITALPTFGMRLAFATVPLWQIAVSLVILTASAAGAIWLAARAFRLGMLRYGQRLGWRELLGRSGG
jgi:ABC-2 type transport system permease protein